MKKALFISVIVIASIAKQSQAQIITTVAGNGIYGYSGDGGQATAAQLDFPFGVACDVFGNLYIADSYNAAIRKVSTLGIINTIAGNGISGFSGDGGQATAAELNSIFGIYVDVIGNLYIADGGNNRIRKVNTLGIITTVVGNGTNGYSGDGGQATAAELNYPNGLTIDILGNIYIVDNSNNCIRKISTSGIITTVAGNGTAGFSGDGGQATAAELNLYSGAIAVDVVGNLFLADGANERIRKVNTAGIITTIAGNGTQGYNGDNGQATNAQLDYPWALCTDASGNLYIADH